MPPVVSLPKMRQRIYDYVVAHPQGISADAISDHIYRDDPNGGPENAPVCVRTQIWFINHKCLRPLGLEIKGKSGQGSLYRLVRVGETKPSDRTLRRKRAQERDKSGRDWLTV